MHKLHSIFQGIPKHACTQNLLITLCCKAPKPYVLWGKMVLVKITTIISGRERERPERLNEQQGRKGCK